jgi:hypothetical protein
LLFAFCFLLFAFLYYCSRPPRVHLAST